jgi:hypothetical protein
VLILREKGQHKTFSFPTKKRFKNSGYCGYIVVSQWFLVVSREYVSRFAFLLITQSISLPWKINSAKHLVQGGNSFFSSFGMERVKENSLHRHAIISSSPAQSSLLPTNFIGQILVANMGISVGYMLVMKWLFVVNRSDFWYIRVVTSQMTSSCLIWTKNLETVSRLNTMFSSQFWINCNIIFKVMVLNIMWGSIFWFTIPPRAARGSGIIWTVISLGQGKNNMW